MYMLKPESIDKLKTLYHLSELSKLDLVDPKVNYVTLTQELLIEKPRKLGHNDRMDVILRE